jgi:GAF domain-containing protein
LLLQLAGAPAGVETTVSYAAERLGLRHHTVVELSKRCEDAGLCTPILCASKVVGVINLQHHLTYHHKENEVRLLSMLGFLVGAEIERARVETENAQLANRLESRKAVERAKGALYCNVTWV